MDKVEEIAIVKQAFESKLNENWERLKVMKEEYQKENEKLRKQLEEQRNENAQLKFSAIESTKNLESLHKKEQMIQVKKFFLTKLSSLVSIEINTTSECNDRRSGIKEEGS